VVDPATNQIFFFKEGRFNPYHPFTKKIDSFQDVHALIETAAEMETNNIEDATRENLPVYLHN
jgi:hypothetical protein